jgi:hypothetical protein
MTRGAVLANYPVADAYAEVDECIGPLAIVEWSVTCPESRLLGQVDYISYGVVKWLTELFTLSLLPETPIESTV